MKDYPPKNDSVLMLDEVRGWGKKGPLAISDMGAQGPLDLATG